MALSESLAHAGATPRASTLGKIADLLERNGIDIDEVGRVQRVSLYQSMLKNADGEAEIHDLAAVQLLPAWADGPAWPVVQPSSAVKVRPVPPRPKQATDWNTAVILPDIQIGYYRGDGGALEAIHDEAALSVALAVVRDARPDLVVMVGDNLDLAEFGKYRLTPAFAQTTQATIDRGAMVCAELRQVAPDARIVWIAGNHEERLPNHLLDNARAAFGLRRGGETPESWPVMSVPFLCRFDDHGIEYLPGYPASSFWVNERLRVIHGNRVVSGGSTAHKYLASEKVSVIYGHVHRREYGARTRTDYDGAKEVMAASPGCLARTDGVVPSTKGGTDLDGRPVFGGHEDWQQGLAVVRFQSGDGRFTYENIAIHQGWAMWQGKEYGVCGVGL